MPSWEVVLGQTGRLGNYMGRYLTWVPGVPSLGKAGRQAGRYVIWYGRGRRITMMQGWPARPGLQHLHVHSLPWSCCCLCMCVCVCVLCTDLTACTYTYYRTGTVPWDD